MKHVRKLFRLYNPVRLYKELYIRCTGCRCVILPAVLVYIHDPLRIPCTRCVYITDLL